jgi:hypothetical protein
MNKEELNWLLQTIKDTATAKRFVAAQYQHERISLEVMADVSREQGWITRSLTLATRHSTECATTELPIAVA